MEFWAIRQDEAEHENGVDGDIFAGSDASLRTFLVPDFIWKGTIVYTETTLIQFRKQR